MTIRTTDGASSHPGGVPERLAETSVELGRQPGEIPGLPAPPAQDEARGMALFDALWIA